jgi:Flp pilus assembly protein TadD
MAMPAHAGWLFGGDDDAPKQSGTAADAKDAPKLAPAADIEGNVRQARMLRLAGNYQEAIHHLSQLMLVASDNGQVVGEYGKTLAQMGRAEDAVHFLTRAEQLTPDDWTIASALGVAYDELGNQNNAQAAYIRALKLRPDEASVLNNYALSRLLAHDPQKARELAERARAAGGAADPKIARNLAMIDDMAPPSQNEAAQAQDGKNGSAPSKTAAADTAAAAPVMPALPTPAIPAKTLPAATPAPAHDGTAYAVSGTSPARPFVTVPTPAAEPVPAAARTDEGPAPAAAPVPGKIDIAARPAPVQPRGVVMQKVPVDPMAGPVAAAGAHMATLKPHTLAAKAPASPAAPAADRKPAVKIAKSVPAKSQPARIARNSAKSPAGEKPAPDKIPALRLSANAY